MTTDDPNPNTLFVSHSRKNKAEVYPFVEALVHAGIEVWIDRNEIDPFDDFPARVREGLARSGALLAWYSPEYAESSYCQKELTAAWICTQQLTSDVLSRILILNPGPGVEHIALGDVGRQNYLEVPKGEVTLATSIEWIRKKLAGVHDGFAMLRKFVSPEWYPAFQQGSARFVGRLRELWRIHTALNPVGISDYENPSILVQLNGMGGMGKSLLAIEYAKRFGAAYPGGIYWLRAYGFDTQKTMDAGARERERQRQIENLAFLHDVEIGDRSFREVFRDLSRKLRIGKPYLWIVDDLPPGLDQRESIAGWFAPSTNNGHTLITTRTKDYAGLGTNVEIDQLELTPAFQLLTQDRKATTDEEIRDVQALAEDLGRHALALDVAGRFLLRTKSFAGLSYELAHPESDPLGDLIHGFSGQLPGGHEKSIVLTLRQSIGSLDAEGLNLLRLAVELHGGTPIPLSLAKMSFGRAFNGDVQAVDAYLARAVNQLDSHSLATVSLGRATGDVVWIHTLVRYTVLRCDPAQEKAVAVRATLRDAAVLALIELVEPVADIRQHGRLELELAHASHLASQLRSPNEARLAGQIARFEGERGSYREAREIAEKARPILERTLGPDDPATLSIRSSIARWTGNAGDAREALRLLEELLPDHAKVLGSDHPATLTIRAHIANWTGEAGDARKALRLFQELLPDRERVLGQDHPDVLKVRVNIARWSADMGDPREALRVYREILPVQMRIRGADHPDTLRARGNIAAWTGETGQGREALRLYKDLLLDQTRVMGPSHSDTLTTRNNVAGWTAETGDVLEALCLFEDLLRDLVRVLGPDHPDTLRLRSNIAAWTGEAGKGDEALRLYMELLPDETRVLGPTHPYTLTTRRQIAVWIANTGDVREGMRLLQELLLDQARVLGPYHAATMETREWIRVLERRG